MITLTTAGFPDHLKIAQLHAANWRDNYREILSKDFLEHRVEQFMLDTWQEKLQQPPETQITTIAYRDKVVAGFCCLVLDDDPLYGSMLDNLHVAATEQNHGVGKLLMQHCAEIILGHASTHRMYLWVYVQNIKAIAVYERWGGRKAETVEKLTAEGTKAMVYRYAWDDVSVFL
jgi:GNAT superfamily N-acetyltransferase